MEDRGAIKQMWSIGVEPVSGTSAATSPVNP